MLIVPKVGAAKMVKFGLHVAVGAFIIPNFLALGLVPVPEPEWKPERISGLVGEKIVVPSYISKGINNYKMEFRRALFLGALSNRSVCETPMIHGKEHELHEAVLVSDIYNTSVIQNYVALTPSESCQCSSQHMYDCTSKTAAQSDIKNAYHSAACLISKGCLSWLDTQSVRDSIRLWEQLVRPDWIRTRARNIANELFGSEKFMTFHWRFEEGKCKGKSPLGLCFRTPSFRSSTVVVEITELASIILDQAKSRQVNLLYLASDGRFRNGGKTIDSLKKVLGGSMTVKEWTDIPAHFKTDLDRGWHGSELEQEICTQSDYFLGSSMSSWSWETMYPLTLKSHDHERSHNLLNLLESCSSEGRGAFMKQVKDHDPYLFDFIDVLILAHQNNSKQQLEHEDQGYEIDKFDTEYTFDNSDMDFDRHLLD